MYTSNSIFLKIICVVLIANLKTATFAYTLEETCAYYGNGIIGDCEGWGFCLNGTLTKKGQCDGGKLFDVNRRKCSEEFFVECRLQQPVDLHTKKLCDEQKNEKNEICFCQLDQYKCIKCDKLNSNSMCRLIPDDDYIADPLGCGKFLKCFDGKASVTGLCPGNHKYNVAKASCNENGICPKLTPDQRCVISPSEKEFIESNPFYESPFLRG